MDFDETRRLHRSLTGAIGDMDYMGRKMREMDSVARSLREMDSVASSLRERDSVARSIREMNAASSLSEMAVGAPGLRELNAATGGAYDQARRYLELEDSIQRQLRRDLQEPKAVGMASMIRELASQTANEDWRRSFEEVAGRVSSAYALARSANFEELNRRADLLRDFTSVSPILGMLARDLARSVGAGALTPGLADGFGAELLGYIEEAEAADSEEAVEAFLQEFIAWLLTQAQRLPEKELIRNALMGLLWFIVQFLVGQYFDNISEQNLRREILEVREEARQDHEETMSAMREMEARLTETLVKAQAKDDDGQQYIVIKDANLRKGPGKNFESLKVLPPNLQVEELERDGEWSRVQYFDYVEGEAREGWIATELLVAKQEED